MLKRKCLKNYNKNSVAVIVPIFMIDVAVKENLKKLRGLSLRANYTDRAIARLSAK
jgi:hypothetical protein